MRPCKRCLTNKLVIIHFIYLDFIYGMLKILMIKAGYFLKKKMLNCIFSEFSVLSWSLLTINFFFLLRKTAQYPFFPQQFTSTSIPNLILVLCCQISTTSRPCRNLVWLTPLHGSRDNATSEVWCEGEIHCNMWSLNDMFVKYFLLTLSWIHRQISGVLVPFYFSLWQEKPHSLETIKYRLD